MATKTEINYLSKNDLKEINNTLVPISERGFLYEGGVDFVAYGVVYEYEDLPIKDTIIGKAAYLWYQIASNQYFVNGNKRTGFTAADVFLRINGFTLTANIDEKQFLSSAIARGVYFVESVRVEIAQHIK